MNISHTPFFTALVLAGFMIPAHAFNINNWFSSLSPRSKGAVYLTAAAMVAGVSYLAYKILAKRSVPVVPEVPTAVVSPVPAPAPAVEPIAPLAVPPAQEVLKPLPETETVIPLIPIEGQHGDWKIKSFKLGRSRNSGVNCVALGANKKGETIILVGSRGYIFYINEKMKRIKTIRFAHEEDVDAIKILPNDLFIAQSSSFVRLYNLEGEILNEFAASAFPETYRKESYFVGIDLGFDTQGKPLLSIAQSSHGSFERPLIINRTNLGHVDVVHCDYNRNGTACIVARDEDGNMKIFCKKGVLKKLDVATGKEEPYGRVLSAYEKGHFDTPDFMVADGDGNIMTHHGDNTIRLSSVKTGVQWGSATNVYWFMTAALGKDGHCVVNTSNGALEVHDLKKGVRTTAIPAPHATSSRFTNLDPRPRYVSLDTRFHGNPYFVSAARDGTVRLWTNEKEKEEQEARAQRAVEVVERFKGKCLPVQRIIHGYVGPDAHQALAELQREKKERKAGDEGPASPVDSGEQDLISAHRRSLEAGVD